MTSVGLVLTRPMVATGARCDVPMKWNRSTKDRRTSGPDGLLSRARSDLRIESVCVAFWWCIDRIYARKPVARTFRDRHSDGVRYRPCERTGGIFVHPALTEQVAAEPLGLGWQRPFIQPRDADVSASWNIGQPDIGDGMGRR